MLLNKNLETPRLTIRSWRKSDKNFTLSLWGDKENGKYMSDPLTENMDEAYLRLIDEMANVEGVDEALKLRDPLGYVQRMNNIRNRAEEIVDSELIYN